MHICHLYKPLQDIFRLFAQCKYFIRLSGLIMGIILCFSLNARCVTRQLCPMLEVNSDRDFQLQLEDVKTIFRCQENFPFTLTGLGDIQFKPDIVSEYHQIDLDDQKHERKLELVLKPEFRSCEDWEVSILSEGRKYPLDEEKNRNRWWITINQSCIRFYPTYFRHEERDYPHDPEDNRIENEAALEVESKIQEGVILSRKIFAEDRKYPHDAEKNRLRFVTTWELEREFVSSSLKGSLQFERRQFPNDPEHNRWEVELSFNSGWEFSPFTLQNKIKYEERRFPYKDYLNWKIRKFLIGIEPKLDWVDLDLSIYWKFYRRPNNPTSSTNRDQTWLKMVAERSFGQLEVKALRELRWRKVEVKPENNRLIKIFELEFLWAFSQTASLLFDWRVEDKTYPNDPEDDELDQRLLTGFKWEF